MKHPIRVGATLMATAALFLGSCGFDSGPPTFPQLEIVTQSLPPAVHGVAYNASIHAAGGDSAYAWALTAGSLPPGIAMSVDDLGPVDHAILSGVPQAAGQYSFTIMVMSGDGQTASREFQLDVTSQPLVMETPAVPPGVTGGQYDVQLLAQGGDHTFTWSLVSGSLPAGIELTQQGRLQGVPTTPDTTTFTVEVRSAGQSQQRTFRFAVVPHRPGEYNITVFPVAEIPSAVQPHLDAAVAEWEAALTANLPAVTIPTGFFSANHCGGFGRFINGASTDDILIIVNIVPIDGVGGVLGQAGPCGLRGQTDLPFAGAITLDVDDVVRLVDSQTLTHIISHEIAHVLGFGTIWNRLGLLSGAGGSDPRFTGPRAAEAFNQVGGQENTVPVENQGGAGTRDSHWRQSVFRDERMTGFSAAPGVFQPLSIVSLASMIDLGYSVDLEQADNYSLAAALMATGAGPHEWEGLGHDEILLEPIRILHRDGRTETYLPR